MSAAPYPPSPELPRHVYSPAVNPSSVPSPAYTGGRPRSPFGTLIGGAFCLMLTLVFMAIAGNFFSEHNDAKTWTPVEGKVTRADIDTRVTETRRKGRTTRSTSYLVRVSYEYTANGKLYFGSRAYYPMSGSTSSSAAHEFVARHPAGKPTTVYVDPADPSSSYLELTTNTAAWVLVVIAGFAALGTAFLANTTWARMKGRSAAPFVGAPSPAGWIAPPQPPPFNRR